MTRPWPPLQNILQASRAPLPPGQQLPLLLTSQVEAYQTPTISFPQDLLLLSLRKGPLQGGMWLQALHVSPICFFLWCLFPSLDHQMCHVIWGTWQRLLTDHQVHSPSFLGTLMSQAPLQLSRFLVNEFWPMASQVCAPFLGLTIGCPRYRLPVLSPSAGCWNAGQPWVKGGKTRATRAPGKLSKGEPQPTSPGLHWSERGAHAWARLPTGSPDIWLQVLLQAAGSWYSFW